MKILKNIVDCSDCAFKATCGGISVGETFWGCYFDCANNCNVSTCDHTCPNNVRLFVKRMDEIEGKFEVSEPNLKVPPARIPLCVHKIHNGSDRHIPIRLAMAAIPVRGIIEQAGSTWVCRLSTPAQLRHKFCISRQTPFVISCISHDGDIEPVWRGLRYGNLAEEFARLKPTAIIAPNFSAFIEDVPRIHFLHNRKRICIAARILSDAGCPVILPLSALTPDDWKFWYGILEENPNMMYVAKEFQTGLSNSLAANSAIRQLAKLQQQIRRPLHLVAVGGGQFRDLFKNHFDKYSIIESWSFMATVNRKRLVRTELGTLKEVDSPTMPGQSLDDLLRWNIAERAKQLNN